ncbi:GNAT family N-acetyltransferase [uncultured Jannaschia sp.]|uniref:GNAT family N-acetyltransferase n=1 Tax=uncultured Jannaschia sp. TaxID=293347 RepID=UPI002639B2A2|nr:GNAT family N-acetyltransferase [uncultured Jannaschia sp.]
MIRIAGEGDIPRIRSCAELAYSRYVTAIGRKPAPMVADFASQIVTGDVYVATDAEGEILGFIVFFEELGYIMLENVAVFPEAAGRGVGKELVGFCEETARRRGLDAVHLYTNEKMTENLSIYPRLGYLEVGRRTEDGFNRVYFKKSVS